MATIRKSMADLRDRPFRFSAAEKDRLSGLTDPQVDAARGGEDVSSDEELANAVADREVRREVRRIREARRMSQAEFAAHYRITMSRLRDWEQGRYRPDSLAMTYLRMIEEAPDLVETVLRNHPERAA